MLIHKAYRFRIYPTPEQEVLFWKTAGCCRAVWNAALFQRQHWGRAHRLSTYGQIMELPALKREFPWLREAPHHCLQQALIDLGRAFENFWSGLAAYPRPKKRASGISFRFPDPKQFFFTSEQIKLPKAGPVAWRQHRIPKGRPISTTVSFDGGMWFASVACEVEITDPVARTGPTVGIDMGVARPLQLSDGKVIHLPRMDAAKRHRRRVLAQRLSAKRKGSANRRKAIRRLAAFDARMARRRTDAAHKATTWIIQTYGAIAIEDLRLNNMTASAKGTAETPGRMVRQKAGLNRSLLDVAPGQIRRQLTYKAGWHGNLLDAVQPFNSSNECSVCGHCYRGNRENQATFLCKACGHRQNADWNASAVIERRAFGPPTRPPTGGRPGIACEVSRNSGQQQELIGAIP